VELTEEAKMLLEPHAGGRESQRISDSAGRVHQRRHLRRGAGGWRFPSVTVRILG
jgi:hypothetical protein